MFAALRQISLPLVMKELLEQATRRRTYFVRVAYATLFYFACLVIMLPEMSQAGNSPLSVLGIGRVIFISLVGWQFAGIYLFLPALACSVLTVEKERNTLGLLFLTKLGPWTIIFEKLLSRLLPMFCLMLCSLPLLAFSMSFGGVNTLDLVLAVWYLSLTAFQICAIAVACSAIFRTTTGALLTCYLTMFLLGFGIPLLDSLVFDMGIANFLRRSFGQSPFGANIEEVVEFAFVGFVGFIVQVNGPLLSTQGWPVAWFNIAMALPLICSGLVALLVARICLVRRAFLPASNIIINFLRRLDRGFHALNNNRVTRGIMVIPDSISEPEFTPIAWRETHKRSLGQTRYLVRVLLALEIPVLVVVMTVIGRSVNSRGSVEVTGLTTVIVWVVSALLIIVTSAGLISGERGRQTLDILLTLPLEGRQIIQEKMTGVCRLGWICALPLVTCIVFEAWWRDVWGMVGWRGGFPYVWWEYLLTELSMVAIYIPLLIWLSLWIGLKVKSPTRATLTALAVVVAWCIIPLLVIIVAWELCIGSSNQIDNRGFGWLLQLSPAFLLGTAEFDELGRLSSIPLFPMVLNALFFGACTFRLRAWVLSSADELLGRSLRKPPLQAFRESQIARWLFTYSRR